LRGHRNVVAYLLTQSADKNIIDRSGKSAIAWARTNNFKDIEKLLD
jgi:ankyrin repeat protein